MPAGRGRIGQRTKSRGCGFLPTASAQHTGRLHAGLLTGTPAPRAKPLRSSQPVHAQGAWQGLPAGVFLFPHCKQKCERTSKLRGSKDKDGASFPLLDETLGRANWCGIMHISNCSSSALAFWSRALSSCLRDQPLLYINL